MRLKNLQRGGAGSKKKLRRGGGFRTEFPHYGLPAQKKRAGKNQKQTKQPNKKQTMKTTQLINRSIRSTGIVAFGLLSSLLTLSETAQAQVDLADALVAPTVFQAAGPTNASIQGTVDAFRTALGIVNNANNPGPLASGRREINWDGGNPAIMDTTPPVNPFNGFLNTRGARFTTPGLGLSQAAPIGLETLFANKTYGEIFRAFSPSRLFTPVGSNVTDTFFFVPGTNGAKPAAVTGFGVIFTDVDQPDGRNFQREASTVVEYFDRRGKRIFASSVPASPGDGNFSFLGIMFADARIAVVRITAGDDAPGPNDDANHDIVMMDDFIYGEPQVLQGDNGQR